MSEFAMADLTGGQLNAIVKKLGGHEGALRFLRGESEVTVHTHVIDCDANPLIPYDGWMVEEHKKGGQFNFDPTKINLFLSPIQQNGKTIKGDKLRKEVESKSVLNANVLDYLLNNPHLIPEEWKVDGEGRTRYIFFWGTIYRRSDGNLYVRYLCWDGGHCQADFRWLGDGWGVQGPAAALAS